MIQAIGIDIALPPTLAAIQDLAIYILPVLGSMLLSYGIYQVIAESKTSDRKKLQDRLRGKKTAQKEIDPILRRGALGQSKTFADSIVGKFKFVPKLQTMLDQADLDWSAAQVLLNLSGGAVLITVALIVFKIHPVLALGCGVSVLLLPMMWINFRRAKRLRKITSQLPDVFDMMSQALRAGHALGGAVQIIYEQMPPPIATEFAQVYHEQNLGVRIEDALQSMADRVDSLDVRFFVTAVVIQRQTGGDLAEVLDNISNV
ncbi:MAG: type II secretion system F family protein, partial [Planctomycetes bacterium]|nr:type II secretion system F family protein [Planctomycetota bacterium]